MSNPIPEVLADIRRGDRTAADRLASLVYDDLRAMAARYMEQERPDHTLQPTAVVHEAYLRMVDQSRVDWRDRAHFLAVAAAMIRRILVDHARRRGRLKRGGDRGRVSLPEAVERLGEASDVDLLALDEALDRLGELNQRQRRVVEMRFFGGLTIEDTAHVLDVSPATIKAEWHMARGWLRQRLVAGTEA